MIKNLCFVVLCILSFFSIAFSQTDLTPLGECSGQMQLKQLEEFDQRSASAFTGTHLHFRQIHMCDRSLDFASCGTNPSSLTFEQPAFWHELWSPITQNYVFFGVITDLSGTVVCLGSPPLSVFPAGWNQLQYIPCHNFPNGDYIYTSIFLGQTDGSMGVSRQVLFSIR